MTFRLLGNVRIRLVQKKRLPDDVDVGGRSSVFKNPGYANSPLNDMVFSTIRETTTAAFFASA